MKTGLDERTAFKMTLKILRQYVIVHWLPIIYTGIRSEVVLEITI